MICVGQRVKYDPFAAISFLGVCDIRKVVVGAVVYVNHKRKWFTVESEGVRTGFSFSDIGKDVRLIK